MAEYLDTLHPACPRYKLNHPNRYSKEGTKRVDWNEERVKERRFQAQLRGISVEEAVDLTDDHCPPRLIVGQRLTPHLEAIVRAINSIDTGVPTMDASVNTLREEDAAAFEQ